MAPALRAARRVAGPLHAAPPAAGAVRGGSQPPIAAVRRLPRGAGGVNVGRVGSWRGGASAACVPLGRPETSPSSALPLLSLWGGEGIEASRPRRDGEMQGDQGTGTVAHACLVRRRLGQGETSGCRVRRLWGVVGRLGGRERAGDRFIGSGWAAALVRVSGSMVPACWQ